MIVVAYLYNKNGMATWCLEAALALHEAGKKVLLVKSGVINLPNNYPVTTINFDERALTTKRTLLDKVNSRIDRYWQLVPFVKPNNQFLPQLHDFLVASSITPTHYLLNQTSLVNNAVFVPQYVVAWTYQPFLKDYLRKAFLLSTDLKLLLLNIYNAIYWHKIDWYGYKHTTSVMAVSDKLATALQTSGINATRVYPGSGMQASEIIITNNQQVVRFAMMALSVDDKRKGYKPIIEILKQLQPYQFTLTLIGGYTEVFKQWVLENNFPAVFTGLLPREAAVKVLENCDVLLFGSLVDDWGFVQVEAMARGLAILSPNASPFDEIIGRTDYLYEADNVKDLENKLASITSSGNITNQKKWFLQRYHLKFSLQILSKQLIELISPK